MKHSRSQAEDEAVVVVLQELLERVNAVAVAQQLELLHQFVVIELDEVVKVGLPEVRGGAGAEEVVEVDGRPTHLHELEIDELDLVGPDEKRSL